MWSIPTAGVIRRHSKSFILLLGVEFLKNEQSGSTISTNRSMIKSTLKIARCCPLVIQQGFSNFLGLFQVSMANPNSWHLLEAPLTGNRRSVALVLLPCLVETFQKPSNQVDNQIPLALADPGRLM